MPPLWTLDLNEALARHRPNVGGDSCCIFLGNYLAGRGIPSRILVDHGILMLKIANHGLHQEFGTLQDIPQNKAEATAK